MPQRPVAVVVIAITAAGAAWLAIAFGWQKAALFGVGAAAGVVLYRAAFGFASSWRAFVNERRAAGVRAQLLMLAIACAAFFPLLAAGSAFGQPLRGSVAPAGLAVVVGAFLFGAGMQLGGGCASGTLYSAGGGNTRMLATLAAFIAGSVLALRHASWWAALPATKPLSLVALFGPWRGLLLSLAALGLLAALTLLVERRVVITPPLAAGAVGLALVNIATLLLAGRPWGVVSAFGLWGSKLLAAAGANVAAWPYWTATPARTAELRASVFNDVTSLMDFGIMLGALLAAALAGRFAPIWRISPRDLGSALIGGLMLGYGARIASGCNIGALFSGIASGSLHGWLWFAAALAGSAAASRLLLAAQVDEARPRHDVAGSPG